MSFIENTQTDFIAHTRLLLLVVGACQESIDLTSLVSCELLSSLLLMFMILYFYCSWQHRKTALRSTQVFCATATHNAKWLWRCRLSTPFLYDFGVILWTRSMFVVVLVLLSVNFIWKVAWWDWKKSSKSAEKRSIEWVERFIVVFVICPHYFICRVSLFLWHLTKNSLESHKDWRR